MVRSVVKKQLVDSLLHRFHALYYFSNGSNVSFRPLGPVARCGSDSDLRGLNVNHLACFHASPSDAQKIFGSATQQENKHDYVP